MSPKKLLGVIGGPQKALIEALNNKPSIKLEFDIGGSPEKPSFSGLQESAMELVKDDIKDLAGKSLKEKAGEAWLGIKEKIKGTGQ